MVQPVNRLSNLTAIKISASIMTYIKIKRQSSKTLDPKDAS